MPKHDYVSCFPYPKMREQQRSAIEFIIDAFENGKRFVLLQAPTGVGKSLIGVTVARYMNKHASAFSYVLTTQKILQDQYNRDFGPTSLKLLRTIKSSSNYTCDIYSDQSCGESRRALAALGDSIEGTEYHNHCKFRCNYALEKRAFLGSPIGVTNFSYFLAETRYAGALKERGLLVTDECHTIENELSKFIEISFSERFSIDQLNCSFPETYEDLQVFEWVKNEYKISLEKKITGIKEKIGTIVQKDTQEFLSLSKQLEKLDKHICKVNRFLAEYSIDNWVLNIIDSDGSKKRKLEFKPIDVSSFSEEYLFKYGEKVLMMSATVVNKDVFCRSVGVCGDDVAYFDVPSPFDPNNKPVHFIPVGSMSKKAIDTTLPVLCETIKMLLKQHSKEKGLIHSVSFKVADHIKRTIKSKRLLFHNSENREEVLKQHLTSKDPTVLVSPSMAEGVDLADDASRFQIVCKLPFPYLGDKLVMKRMQRDSDWYAYETAKQLIQSLGRSIRNENDHAVSYILDGDFEGFFRRNKHLFPVDTHPK